MIVTILSLAILLPTGAPLDTTPLTCFSETTLTQLKCIPEESPEGGHPEGWADNSPTYTDGWMLQVNDSTHTIQWIAPPPHDPIHSDIELGA